MNQSNTTQFFKTLQLLYLALVSGQVLFGAAIWWLLSKSEAASAKGLFTGNGFLALIILAWMVFSSFMLYQKRTKRALQNLKDLSAKLRHYRMSSIFRWAMLELGNLLVVIIAYLEQNMTLLLLFAIGMAAFYLAHPSPQKFSDDYQLTEKERNEAGEV